MPKPLQLTPEEVGAAFGDDRWVARFPPVLSLPQFAELFQVSVRTAKSWIASGDFDGATTRMGKHRRVWRDRAVRIAFGRGRTRPRAASAPSRGSDDAGPLLTFDLATKHFKPSKGLCFQGYGPFEVFVSALNRQ